MIVGSILKAPSVIEARVTLSHAGEGVPRQKSGMRCGVVCVVSKVSIVPVPLIDCGPGVTQGGGVCEKFTVAR
jgi:hypothetical protein